MKIIKNNDVIEVKCPHCRSELQVEYDDIEGGHVFGHGTNTHVYCGACGESINVAYSNLPEHWKCWIDLKDPDCD